MIVDRSDMSRIKFDGGLSGTYENYPYITKKEIDAFLSINRSKNIQIGPMKQNEFNYFVEKSLGKFTGILFEDLRVDDLSPLEKLENIETIFLQRNIVTTKLWNMSNNSKLKNLEISHFTKLRNIDEIQTAKNLTNLWIDDGAWSSMVINTLAPLKNTKIEYIRFAPKKIIDLNLEFLSGMLSLEEISFPLNFFTSEALAWMRAKIPNLKGWAIAPYFTFPDETVFICGKGKPRLKATQDNERIAKYEKNFWQLVEYYKNNDICWRN